MNRIITLAALLFAFPASAATVDLEWHIGVGTTNNATINVGDTVRWTWTGALPHTVETSSGPTSFNSGLLVGVGQTFSYTFNEVGDWNYFCGVHGPALMGGTITVEEPLVPSLSWLGIATLCSVLALVSWRRLRG